jgi:CHAT domain-containing protein
MRQFYFLLITIVLLVSCSSKKQDQANIPAPVHIANDTNLIFIDAEEKLRWLVQIKDSLPAYIRLNEKYFDSAKKLNKEKAGERFLENIIQQHKLIIADTSLKKILAKAYAWWGFIKYAEKYNDTVVNRLEQFLLLTNDQQPVHPSTPYALLDLGVLYNILGDIKKCSYYYSQFSNYAKSVNNTDWYAAGIINTTIALNELRLYDSSVHLITPLLSDKAISGRRIATLYANLAVAQSGKRLLTESLISGNRSLQILNGLGLDVIDSTHLLEKKYEVFWNMGDINLAAGNLKDAEVNLNNALRYLMAFKKGDVKNRESGKLLLSQGRLYEAMGKLPQALALYHKALYCVTSVDSNAIMQLPARKELYRENTIMEALDAKAAVLQKMYAASNNPDLLIQAVRCYELAFETESKLMRGFSYDESLMHQTKESKTRSEKGITACFELFRVTRSASWTEIAFLFAERSKGVVLQESIKRNFAVNSSLQQDSNWLQVQRHQQEVNFYETKLATTTPLDTATANLLTAAENKLLLAKTALLHNNYSYRDALLKTDSLSATILKKELLDNSTSLIEFFAGDSSTFIFIFTKNSSPAFLKADRSLSQTLDNFLRFFTDKNKINNEPASYQAAAYQLYKQVGFSTIHEAITKLIIIPDGILNFVPFEALITSIKSEQNPGVFSYLLLQKQIFYGYSAATLLKQSEYQSTSSADNIYCFAPVFANNERGKHPLLYTIGELNGIKKEKPSGKYFIKSEATLTRFKENINSASVIHIASHANADTSRGMQPLIEFYDSTLYLNEIYTMHINPALVVLSACETGIGVIDKSEGAMSLARGFYYAGAKNIITSLWSVDDRSTAEIFNSFYSHTNDNNYAMALRKAKLTYLENATTSASSPYYWAAFVHIGYEKQQEKSSRLPWMIAAVLSIAFISIFILRKRK